MNIIAQNIKSVIVGLAVAAGLSYAVAWTGPGSNPPPTNNVAAPINVGSSVQTKLGSLIVNGSTTATYTTGFTTFGLSNFYGQIAVMDGSQGAGKVLQSNAAGLATWVSTSSLGIAGGGGSTGAVSKIIAGTNITVSPTTGVGNVTVNRGNAPVVGSVIGGCYLSGLGDSGNSFAPKYIGWGGATGGTGTGSAAGRLDGSGCTCPPNTAGVVSGAFLTSGVWYSTGYMCTQTS